MEENDIKRDNEAIVQMPGQIKMSDIGVEESVFEPTEVLHTIEKDTVKTVQIGEATDVDIPSYMIDLSEAGEVISTAVTALSTMLEEDGDTSVYIKGETGLFKIGKGREQRLYNELEVYVKAIFSNKGKVYKNSGDGYKELKAFDANSVILSI